MPTKGLLTGPKFNRRHTTYNELAARVIKALKPLEAVRKIVIGPIKPIRVAHRRVTLREDKGQVRLQCRDINSVQLLWVIGADVAVLKNALVRRKLMPEHGAG